MFTFKSLVAPGNIFSVWCYVGETFYFILFFLCDNQEFQLHLLKKPFFIHCFKQFCCKSRYHIYLGLCLYSVNLFTPLPYYIILTVLQNKIPMPLGTFIIEKQGSLAIWGEWGEILCRREGRKWVPQHPLSTPQSCSPFFLQLGPRIYFPPSAANLKMLLHFASEMMSLGNIPKPWLMVTPEEVVRSLSL